MHIHTSAHPLTWKSALKNKSFRKDLFLSIVFLGAVLFGFIFVLEFVENRSGFSIEKDWLNKIIAPRDFSSWIFTCTYGAIIPGIVFCFLKPDTAILLIRTYLILQFLRAITLLLVPLNPPEGIIPLQDPFLHATFYDGRQNLKDLFFSGHVATLVMFVLVVPQKWVKWLLIIAAIAAGVLLIGQRVHYVVDVIAAPVFAVAAFKLAKRWSKNYFPR
ncbi:MAG: hypothetical protein M3R17_11935 [Bacteroidota bacterium]|nr:hypothetical protein [Bacteroidota bacterium]